MKLYNKNPKKGFSYIWTCIHQNSFKFASDKKFYLGVESPWDQQKEKLRSLQQDDLNTNMSHLAKLMMVS